MAKKQKTLFSLVIVIAINASLVFAAGNSKADLPKTDFRNVVLIGWDGTDRGTLINLLEAGKLPNLKKIMQAGSFVETEITTGKTETKPGWAEILTGYSSQTVGVISNRVEYKPIPKGYTIFEKLKKQGILTIFLAGKRSNLGALGPHSIWVNGPRDSWDLEEVWSKDVPPPKADELIKHEGQPYALTKESLDVYQNGLGKGEAVIKKALECIKQFRNSRFFLFAHFEEPDEQGHVYGGYSDEYKQAILKDDLWLGKIISELKNCGIYEKTLIYVVNDHGFDINGRQHKYEPHTFLVTNDSKVIQKTGDRKDITPTLLSRYGFDLNKISPALEGHPLNEKK